MRNESVLETSLTRDLRYELLSQDGRALIGSTSLSFGVGLLWVLLVVFGPRTNMTHLLPPEERPIEVRFEDPPPPPPPPAPKPAPTPTPAKPAAPAPSAEDRAKAREAQRVASAASAFGAPAKTNGPVGDVSNVLRGVDVHSATTNTGATGGGKTVIAYGQGGEGSRTPGRTDLAGAGSQIAGVGQVGASGGIGHAAVAVSAPKAVAGTGTGAGARRDVGTLGDAVRSHEPQLRFCYQEYGLKANPSLAGSVTLSLTMNAGGDVTQATISNRTWSGAGVSPTEECILDKARAWRFPAVSGGGAGTYEFSFNFTN